MDSWLDKRGLAAHLACSVRSVENALADGMPHAIIFGRVKFRAQDVEAWLEHTGRLQHRGEATLNGDTYTRRDPHDAIT